MTFIAHLEIEQVRRSGARASADDPEAVARAASSHQKTNRGTSCHGLCGRSVSGHCFTMFYTSENQHLPRPPVKFNMGCSLIAARPENKTISWPIQDAPNKTQKKLIYVSKPSLPPPLLFVGMQCVLFVGTQMVHGHWRLKTPLPIGKSSRRMVQYSSARLDSQRVTSLVLSFLL